MRRVGCVILISVGTALGVALVAVLYLVMRESRSKDKVIAKAVSPDGQKFMELHQVIAPVHGGADNFQVTIGDVSASFGDPVYTHPFECSDFSAFRIWWSDSTHANVRYGPCDIGHPEDENLAQQPLVIAWRDVTVSLDSSGQPVTQ